MNRLVPMPSPTPQLPGLIAAAGGNTRERFFEFFAANIRNKHTRRGYAQATREFLAWCESAGVASIADVRPLHVAAYIEQPGHERSAPKSAAIRRRRPIFVQAADPGFAAAARVEFGACTCQMIRLPTMWKTSWRLASIHASKRLSTTIFDRGPVIVVFAPVMDPVIGGFSACSAIGRKAAQPPQNAAKSTLARNTEQAKSGDSPCFWADNRCGSTRRPVPRDCVHHQEVGANRRDFGLFGREWHIR
jgi:hypothetical protein